MLATSISHSSLRMTYACHIYLAFLTTDDICLPHLSRLFSLCSDRLPESRSRKNTMPSKHHIHLVVLHSGQTDGQCLEAGKTQGPANTYHIHLVLLPPGQSVSGEECKQQASTHHICLKRKTHHVYPAVLHLEW